MSRPVSVLRATLVLYGGGGDEALVALLAGLLPRPDARIEVLTTATTANPARTAASYARSWQARGCADVGHLEIDETHPADAPATLARLRRADLLFLSGGNQERLTDFLENSEFLALLKERCRTDAGFVLAGTSAGAAALAEFMLVDGRGWRSLLPGGIGVRPGLGLLAGVVLDQHFAERHRYPRLLHAVLAHPACLALGLSEETGLLLRPGQPAEVFGDEVIFAFDAAHAQHISLVGPGARQPISGHGVLTHLLVAGQRLDLATRQVVG
ncbi:cyanophycinase [Hymenobacter caeli]|uniref:Cyanophycinase n=1 Tax=Hymenobacter caeli TaxID=2735894 RepID=A0ABX2FS16_9BACT|nr:cyanophycinase [Hymenobacter caeli]NRT19174.1 cyanophycinase [Hymenobacter caeli]